MTISCLYGATEIGCATTLFGGAELRAPEDWSYVRFDERAHVHWAPQADGTFESQFLVRAFKLLVRVVSDAEYSLLLFHRIRRYIS